MPKFEAMKPDEVMVGRGRATQEARRQFREAIEQSQAGRITLDRSDRPSTVKRLLAEASKEAKIKVRSSWEDKRQMVLYWKRPGI
jgi:hypothetical protein